MAHSVKLEQTRPACDFIFRSTIILLALYLQPVQIEANHARACEFIRSAASQGCHLAVLPEYHLTSWVPDDPKFRDLCAQSQHYLDSYCSIANECNICIVAGTIVEERNNTLVNIAYFISNTGQILSSYQKKNLWHPERPYLTSSGRIPHQAFDTPLGKVGLLICWDLAFPEAFRALISSGAKLIIIPAFWLSACSDAGLKHNPLAESLFLESTIVARAFENTCAVIFVNAGGPKGDASKGTTYAGLSQVAVPFKGASGKLGPEEGMSVVELDMQILEDAEEDYRIRQDLGTQGWHYGCSLTENSSIETAAEE